MCSRDCIWNRFCLWGRPWSQRVLHSTDWGQWNEIKYVHCKHPQRVSEREREIQIERNKHPNHRNRVFHEYWILANIPEFVHMWSKFAQSKVKWRENSSLDNFTFSAWKHWTEIKLYWVKTTKIRKENSFVLSCLFAVFRQFSITINMGLWQLNICIVAIINNLQK